MKLYIKNMVCSRCKMVVKSELEKLGLHPINVELGAAEILETNINEEKSALLAALQSLGFNVIDDKKSKIIEKIKNLITLGVMSVSIIGVLQSVFNKSKIQCACLGAVFNLPMSTVTIIEDGLMITMSLAMLVI
ncbi:MAG TPA: hypothetical protein VF273_10895 [Pelobium sp.]